jgi:hypothetical protein
MTDRVSRQPPHASKNYDKSLDAQRGSQDDLDLALDSPAIRRLIEEVRAEDGDIPRSYNRTFNRHNR